MKKSETVKLLDFYDYLIEKWEIAENINDEQGEIKAYAYSGVVLKLLQSFPELANQAVERIEKIKLEGLK